MIQITDDRYYDDQGRELSFPLFDGADSMQAEFDFRIEFSASFTTSFSVNIEGDKATLASGAWEDLGFVEGAPITGGYTDSASAAQTIPGGTTIDFINGAEMIISVGFPGADGLVTSGKFVCDVEPEAFGFQINLVKNTGPENGISLIDGEMQRFEVDISAGMSVGDTEAFSQLGNASGGSNMSPTITRLTDDGGLKSYKIFTQFKQWLVGNEMKQFFASGECVKPWIEIIAYPQFQNPGIKQTTTYSPTAANTGFFDEVYNGGTPDYTLSALTWTDNDGDPMQRPDHTQESNFSFTVSGVFSASSKFNIAFFWDPVTPTLYSNKPTRMENNRAMCTSTTALSVGGPITVSGSLTSLGAGVDIEDLEITQSGTSATVTGKIVPNSQYTALINAQTADPNLINSDRRCRFAVKVQDPDLEDNFIRASWLTVFYGELTKNVKPLGVWEQGVLIQLYDHANDQQTSVITEDDVRVYGRVQIPKNDPDFTGINLKVCAVKDTGESFILENQQIDFSDFPLLPDGSLPVNVSDFNGYALPPSTDKNVKSVTRYTPLDTVTYYGLQFNYGTLIRWQYWLEQPNASFEFFGVNGEGKNQDWQHYRNGDWDVQFILETQTVDGSYENAFPLPINNYDDWLGESEIRWELQDGTPINNPIAGVICVAIAEHTLEPSNAWVGDKWGMLRVYPFEGGPDFTISSVLPLGTDPNNPFQPLNGEVGLKLELSGAQTIKLSCLFDATKIAASNLTFSSRVEGFSDKGGFRRNRHKDDFGVSVKPFAADDEEDMLHDCCDPTIVLADYDSDLPSKNECLSAWERGDEVTFQLLRADGSEANYQPVSVPFAKQESAFYCTIQWRDVLTTAGDGVGCYTLRVIANFAGLDYTYNWGEYELLPYKDNNRGTVMIRSVFNDYNKHAKINFTDSQVSDCIRVKGRFGYFNPNIFTDNERYIDSEAVKVRREKLTTYELRVDRTGNKIVERLVNYHFLAENACWITDHNPDNYAKYRDFPVIFIEDIEPDHKPGNRGVTIGARYEDRVQDQGTFYDQNNPLANTVLPPPVQTNIATVINSAEPPTFSATFSTNSPYVLPDTTVETYELVDGVPVLIDTFTFPTLEPDTEINIDL